MLRAFHVGMHGWLFCVRFLKVCFMKHGWALICSALCTACALQCSTQCNDNSVAQRPHGQPQHAAGARAGCTLRTGTLVGIHTDRKFTHTVSSIHPSLSLKAQCGCRCLPHARPLYAVYLLNLHCRV